MSRSSPPNRLSVRRPSADLRIRSSSSGLLALALSPAASSALLIVGLLFQAGCADLLPRSSTPPTTITAGPGTPSLDAVPAWALANPDRDNANEIGIGSGRSLEEATRYALKDVASRLAVSVSRPLRNAYRETSGQTSPSLDSVIETRIRSARFKGWEQTQSAQTGDDFWVEVKIDRDRLIRDTRSELDALTNRIDEQFKTVRGSGLQETLVFQKTEEDRQRVANLSIVVDALDPSFDRAQWDKRRSSWRVQDTAERRLLIFEVRADPDSRDVARWIHRQLASDQLRARDGNCESDDAVCIDVTTEVVETDMAMRFVAEVRSKVAVRDPGGSLIREEAFVGRGDSSANPGRARRRAYDDLRKTLDVSVVLEGLTDEP